MFDRYTDLARRTIFFARYEASVYGLDHITTEILLLGVLREDKMLAAKLPLETARKHIESRTPRPAESISTSADLPLTSEAKRVLAYAAQEADTLKHRHIEPAHLALGMLRIKKGLAAEILQHNGLDAGAIRAMLRTPAVVEPPPQRPLAVEAPALDEIVPRFRNLVQKALPYLRDFGESEAAAILARREWSRKETLG